MSQWVLQRRFYSVALIAFILFLILGVVVVSHVNRVQAALAAEVHQQQNNVSELYRQLSVIEAQLYGKASLAKLSIDIDQLGHLLGSMRQEYSFKALVGAASAASLLEPVVVDLKHWAHRGIAHYDGDSDIVRFVMLDRTAKSRARLQDIVNRTGQTAALLLDQQAHRIAQIRHLLWLFLGGFALLSALWLWLSLRQARRVGEQVDKSQQLLDGVDAVDNGLLVVSAEGALRCGNRGMAMLLPELEEALALERGQVDMALSRLRESAVIEQPNAGSVPGQVEVWAHGRYLRLQHRPLSSGDCALFVTDITDLKQTQEQLLREATTDALTGLSNRAEFHARTTAILAQSQQSESRFAIMIIDLDHFKTVNDTLGHAAGDKLLITVANRITNSLRGGDFAARMGGDEFAVVLGRVDKVASAATVAERVMKSLHDPLHIKNAEVAISGSIGVAVWPDHAQTLPELINCADAACYRAKHLGRNNYQLYNAELRKKLSDQLTIEARLRKAISNKSFSLVYQPLWDLESGEVVSVEALARWHDEQLGDVPPETFIPLAEKVGSIADVGEWVLSSAVKDLAQWRAAGEFLSGSLSVNVSARQFTLHELNVLVERTLAMYKIPASQLCLEITESALMDDLDKAVSTLEQLHARGVSIIVDDFGIGFSSLLRLRQLPIDAIKIDRSFIRDILHDRDAEALTKTIIAMAKNLRLKVIAEGVETREQALTIQRMGCQYIQGAYFCRPLNAKDMQAFLSRRTRRLQADASLVE